MLGDPAETKLRVNKIKTRHELLKVLHPCANFPPQRGRSALATNGNREINVVVMTSVQQRGPCPLAMNSPVGPIAIHTHCIVFIEHGWLANRSVALQIPQPGLAQLFTSSP